MATKHGKDLKSLLLTAGFGTRLKPLTDVLPKPLVPVYNVPLFDAAIYRCVEAGAKDLGINTHHLDQVMASHANRVYRKIGASSLFISKEIPEILGTGGALAQVSDWWDDSSLLVYNGDILSDLRLLDLVTRHRSSAALVTMAVHAAPPSAGARSVWVGPDGMIKAICRSQDLPLTIPRQGNPLRECGFACAYVAEPELKAFLPHPPKFHDVILSFNDAILAGHQIQAIAYEGVWADVGTPKSLWETNLLVAKMSPDKRSKLLGQENPIRLLSSTSDATIDDISIVGPRVTIGFGAQVSNSVLLDGAIVGRGEVLKNTIRGLGLDESFPSTDL